MSCSHHSPMPPAVPPRRHPRTPRKSRSPSVSGTARRRVNRSRAGVVLVIVLVVVVILSLAAYTFSDLMLTHHQAVQLTGRQMQAQALVESGVETARFYLSQDEATRLGLGGDFSNPTYFQGVSVIYDPDPTFRGNFTVVVPSMDETGSSAGYRYGLEDLSTRLNLNALLTADKLMENGGRELLMALPGMTEDVADAIMDWMDEDEEKREFGAELEYYSQLQPPYAPKNGALDTVEELLLVRGVTPELLFGMDTNRNGMVDAHEMSYTSGTSGTAGGTSSMSLTEEMLGASLDRGWAAYITLYRMEKNVNSAGDPRVSLNSDNMQELYDALVAALGNEEWAAFIVAYRLAEADYTGNEEGEAASAGGLDLSQQPRRKFSWTPGSGVTPLDMVGKKVSITAQGQNQPTIFRSPFGDDPASMLLYLPLLMDNVTVDDKPVIPGRININQAPRTVLVGIPGLDEEKVERILQERVVDPAQEGEAGSSFNHETWLLTSGIVTLDEMKALVPFVNTGGDVFQAQVVGYFESGGGAARAEVVIDTTEATPRILLWRDLSHLGRGYPLEVLGVQLISGF